MITKDERAIVAALGDCWDEFLCLVDSEGSVQADDLTDFRRAIHDAQRIVLSRGATRILRDEDRAVTVCVNVDGRGL